jgi:ribosomal protein S18 acetylase RimI-like enzyme
MLIATTVSTADELNQILQIQQENLRDNISESEKQSEGFVTLQHTPELLQLFQDHAPIIIVKDGNTIAGYALVMLRKFRELIPELEPMFATLDKLTWKERPVKDYRFYVMGQICVAKEYRGKGLVEMLYHKHRDIYQHQFDFIITDVALRNQRSMRAHERIGFKTIHTYRDELDNWAVILWDWK